jgi:hypothetical protein
MAPSEPAYPPAPARASIDWKSMTYKERSLYMRDVVVPQMGQLFRAFDPKTFASFDCTTCHGAGAKDGSFTMPNPALPTMPGNMVGFQALMREKPAWMKFMGGEVRPRMAALLGKDEIDMRNPKPDAFGCKNCHTMGGAPTGTNGSGG